MNAFNIMLVGMIVAFITIMVFGIILSIIDLKNTQENQRKYGQDNKVYTEFKSICKKYKSLGLIPKSIKITDDSGNEFVFVKNQCIYRNHQ